MLGPARLSASLLLLSLDLLVATSCTYAFLLSLTLAIHLRLLQLPLPRAAPRWLTLEATSPPSKHAFKAFRAR